MTKPEAKMFVIEEDVGLGDDLTCEFVEAYNRGNIDADSFLCDLGVVYNFRCGCSKGYGFDHRGIGFDSEAQYNAYVWLPRVTGLLSLLVRTYHKRETETPS